MPQNLYSYSAPSGVGLNLFTVFLNRRSVITSHSHIIFFVAQRLYCVCDVIIMSFSRVLWVKKSGEVV